MKTVFDASFRYKPSFETDVRKTFERIRRENDARRRQVARPANSEVTVNVVQLEPAKKGM